MSGYWPWWAGAVALGLITVGYAAWTGRTLGVSGTWDRVLMWRAAREVERIDAEFDGTIDLREALAAATVEQFGAGGQVRTGDHQHAGAAGLPAGPPLLDANAPRLPEQQTSHPAQGAPRPLPAVFAAALLVSVFLGGLIGALTSGRFDVRTDMGEGFSRLVTDNPLVMTVLLFVGGVMVGFGTRMSGGCSSGHGLTGCSRLHPVSLVATAVFFAAAVVVSLLVWKVI
jgi:uncharacterized membrane protein YedE/YeeE